VVAIGKGRVEFAGRRHGYGNLVEIRHAASYVTRYAHFFRFAAGIRTGKSVNQGEVIGYVGQTGHATGPHLHFEFLRGGEKINFLDLRIEKTNRLVDDDLRRFEQMREKREALLRNAEVELVGADQS
jgi:murein DD-endopeptidase MepM/ murein hydrolase activator NlpD